MARRMVDPKFDILIDSSLVDIVNLLNSEGIEVDSEKVDEHIAKFQEIEEKAKSDLEKGFKEAGHPELKVNSLKDMKKWFFEICGLEPFKVGKTGPSLDAESLEHFATKRKSALFYLDMKRAHAMVNTLTNIKKATREGKIYPQHNLNKAASGRFSSSGANGDKLNINGWPKSIRDILKPASEEKIVSFDYKNIEGAVQYFIAHEEGAIEDYTQGIDMHQKLADILHITRQQAKIIRHGIGYGMTAFGLARRLGCTEEEAEEFIEKFWKHQPKVKTLKQDIINKAHMYGEVITLAGFSRPTKDLSDSQIYSTFIQGTAADLFKLAITNVHKYLKESGRGSIKTLMHDALVCSLKSEDIDTTINEIVHIMETVHPEFTLKVDVQTDKW